VTKRPQLPGRRAAILSAKTGGSAIESCKRTHSFGISWAPVYRSKDEVKLIKKNPENMQAENYKLRFEGFSKIDPDEQIESEYC